MQQMKHIISLINILLPNKKIQNLYAFLFDTEGFHELYVHEDLEFLCIKTETNLLCSWLI